MPRHNHSRRRCPTCGAVVFAAACRQCVLMPKPRPGSYAADAQHGVAVEIDGAELLAVRQAAGLDYLPSPSQIEEAAREIRAGWSEAQRASRVAVSGAVGWVAPEWFGAETEGAPERGWN